MMDKVDANFQIVNELGNDTREVINISGFVTKCAF